MFFVCIKLCFYTFLVACLFNTAVFSTRVVRQSDDLHETTDHLVEVDQQESESFINFSELQNFNLSQLLDVSFINQSVNHYSEKLHQVQSSVQNRLTNLVEDIRRTKTQFSSELTQKLNDSLLKLVESFELTPNCLASLSHLGMELAELRLWPLKFIDAMEFVPSGAFEGLLSSFGSFEECLSIESPAIKQNHIRGKYCLAKIRLPFMDPSFPEASDLELDENRPIEKVYINKTSTYAQKKALFESFHVDFETVNNKLKLLQMINMFNGSYYRMGLCFPSTCSSDELERAINKFLEPFQNPIYIEIEDECSVMDQETVLNNYQCVAILVLIVLGIFVGASTCYEYYLLNYRKTNLSKSAYENYLVTFSSISNTKSLFQNDPVHKRLCVVDTIVLLFVILELIGRSYVLPIFYGMINIKRPFEGLPKEYFTARKFFFIRGSSFAVCTYVLASAVILSYNISTYMHKVKPSVGNYLKYAANRWLSFVRRLIGPLCLVHVMPLLGDGPIWHYYEKLYTEPCKHNLLSFFLFYSNYNANSLDNVCIPPSLILSTLFYLSLLAPLILYAFNYKLIGCVLFGSLIVLGSIGSIIPKLVFNLPVMPYEVSSVTSVTQAKLSFVHYFAASDQLLVVFVCGLFIGYAIKCKPKINLGSQFTNCVIWMGMLALPFISSSWSASFKPVEGNFSQFSFVVWFVLSKIMWSAGIGWVMFACTTGRAGLLSELFHLPILRPPTKLAFTVYLNHITILSYRQLSKKDLGPLTHVEILTDDISDIVIAFAVSYVFYILIERPFYYWIKIVLQLEPHENLIKIRYGANILENGKFNSKEQMHLKSFNNSSLDQ